MKEGVYYRREDYAGFWRRAMVDVVDFIIMAVMVTVSTAAIAPFFPDWFAEVLMGVAGLIWFGYLVVLKGSRFRTPGYRLGRVALVGFDGCPAGWGKLFLRACFVGLGPINFLLDLVWVFSDWHRQALRDKVAQTYLIRNGALPIGKGRIVYRSWYVWGYNLLVREVVVEEAARAQTC